MIPSRFARLLKNFRLAAGLTQEELAARARVSTRGLQDLERGMRRRPRRATLELLAEALGLSPDDTTAFLAAAHARSAPAGAAHLAALLPLSPVNAPTPLVGREAELGVLRRFLRDGSEKGSGPPVLFLAGEPGIGKTRLLHALAAEAMAGGWRVLAGGCQRRGGQEPYAPLVEALAHYIRTMPPERRRMDLAGCAWLTRLLPVLAERFNEPDTLPWQPDQERRLIYAAVERLLVNVAGPAGTLLILDDVQWAGPDALDLVNTLARKPALPLRIVGAYRDTEMRPADPLGMLVADLAHAGLIRRQPLGPLANDDAARLLDDLLADWSEEERTTADRALERAGGVPFFLVSYAQSISAGDLESVPWDLVQGVRQRVALLPEAARQVLDAAAIGGRRVPRTLLAATVAQAGESVLAGLEAACRSRLLIEDGNDGYQFTHDVIREVVEADMGAAKRAALHHSLAEALERLPTGVPAEQLAHHFARGDEPDKAVHYLEQAGDHAWSQRAAGAAESRYRETLDQLQTLGRMAEAARLREKLGGILGAMGRYNDAMRMLTPALGWYQAAGDMESLGRVSLAIAEGHAQRGTPEDGIAHLRSLLGHLERIGSFSVIPALHLTVGALLITTGRYAEALVAVNHAAELARAGGDDRTLARAASNRANLLQLLGQLEEALQAGQDVLPLLEAVGDYLGLLSTLRDLAYIHALRGDFAAGRRSIDHAVAVGEQLANPASLSLTLAVRGWLSVLDGDWTAAHADLDRAPALSREVDRSWYSAYSLILLGRLSLAEGNLPAAAAVVQEAIELSERSGDLQALRWAAVTMATIDILEGRPLVAHDRLIPLLDRPSLEECDVTMFLPILAWAYLELGRLALAADTVEQALARARPENMRLAMVEALRVRAMIALRRERWEDAASSLEEGIALARAMPYPYAEARLLHLEGLLHVGMADSARARKRWEEAQAIFLRLGARRDLERLEDAVASVPA
ncbi:MAG TPA: AAA family ATPase [Chloroflexota bacterium]